jgi:hypothetical protein
MLGSAGGGTTFMSCIFVSNSGENNAEAIVLCDWLISHGWDDLLFDLYHDRAPPKPT